jgi:hypothetical protein
MTHCSANQIARESAETQMHFEVQAAADRCRFRRPRTPRPHPRGGDEHERRRRRPFRPVADLTFAELAGDAQPAELESLRAILREELALGRIRHGEDGRYALVVEAFAPGVPRRSPSLAGQYGKQAT